MKKLIVISACLAALLAGADETNETTAVITRAVEMLQANGWTTDDLAIGLDRLDRWYQSNLGDAKFREQLNGKLVGVVTDTNKLTRTYTYENGTVYVRNFQNVEAMGLKERLNAAAEKVKREEAAKAAAAAKEKARLDRIDRLENHLEEETAALMKRNRWPEELARLYLQNELNKLKSGETVTAIVTPQ